MIIDVHAHAFPDFLAPKAMEVLSAPLGDWKPARDGTLASLEASMVEAGVTRSFVANIATRPEQGPSILAWSKQIASDAIVPLGSVHPASPTWERELESIAEAGLLGIKFHAQFQGFTVDDAAVLPLYARAARLGLFVLFHGGYDIAFPGDQRSAPSRLARVRHRVDDLVMIAAHVGGWDDWDEVGTHLIGRDVYLDTSYIEQLSAAQLEQVLTRHDPNRILLGSDTPWLSQKACIRVVRELPIDLAAIARILGLNALGLHPSLKLDPQIQSGHAAE